MDQNEKEIEDLTGYLMKEGIVMELNKGNMRKIRELDFVHSYCMIVVLWKYEEVLEVLG